MKTTIDSAGRMVIPKAIRERAGLEPGAELEIREQDGQVVISVPAATGSIVYENGRAVWDSGGARITLDEINEAIEAVRTERERAILGLDQC